MENGGWRKVSPHRGSGHLEHLQGAGMSSGISKGLGAATNGTSLTRTRSFYSSSCPLCISTVSSLLAEFSTFIAFQAACPAPFPKVTLCFLLEIFGIYSSHCVPKSRQGKELPQCFVVTVSSRNPSGVECSWSLGQHSSSPGDWE